MLAPRALCAANLERATVPWLIIVCSIFLLWGSSAMAHSVALLRPHSRSASATELLERLRGELLSVGFEVTVRDRPGEAELGSVAAEPWVRSLAAEGKFEAAVDLVGGAVAVDVWIIDDARHFQLLARVDLDSNSENASKGLAIRASEVLRARLFETHTGAEPQRPDSARAPEPPPVAPRAEAARGPEGLGFEVGAAVLTSLDGVGPAVLPLVRLDWAIEPRFLLQATFAGFGTRPSVTTAAGEAEVGMHYGLLGAAYRLNWQHRVSPFGALSLGALRTTVEGRAEAPRESHSINQWSFLVDASLGAALQLSSQFAVLLAGHAQFAEPYVAIHFGEQQVASLGRPNLLLTLTFGVWP